MLQLRLRDAGSALHAAPAVRRRRRMKRREVMMLYLVLGLIIFLGAHSIRVVADPWRMATIARIGEGRWKGLYSLASLVGLVLIIWGYGQARLDPIVLWHPPIWT